MGVPLGQALSLWVCGTDACSISCHNYCQAENDKHYDYFIKTTLKRQQTQTVHMNLLISATSLIQWIYRQHMAAAATTIATTAPPLPDQKTNQKTYNENTPYYNT